MIKRYTLEDEAEIAQWDAFARIHPFGWLCHLTGWKRVLEKSFSHIRGHYLVLLDDEKIKAALPVYEVNSWVTGRRLVSVPFATLCDPLVSSAEDLQMLIDGVIGLSRELAVPLVEIRSLHSSTYFSEHRVVSRSLFSHHYIPLAEPLDCIKMTFHRSCVRQRINRAVKSGIDINEGTSVQDLESFYRLYVMNRKSLGLPPQPYMFIKSLWDEFSPSGNVVLLMARSENRLIGCLLLFRFRQRVSAEFAVWDDKFQHMSPLHGLFWHAIKSAASEGYRSFDFGRTSTDNRSLMDFKNRWGTTVVDMPQFFYVDGMAQDGRLQHSSVVRTLVRGVCMATPLPFYEGMGRFFYRHHS